MLKSCAYGTSYKPFPRIVTLWLRPLPRRPNQELEDDISIIASNVIPLPNEYPFFIHKNYNITFWLELESITLLQLQQIHLLGQAYQPPLLLRPLACLWGLSLNTPLPQVFCVPETHARTFTVQNYYHILSPFMDETGRKAWARSVGDPRFDANVVIRVLL